MGIDADGYICTAMIELKRAHVSIAIALFIAALRNIHVHKQVTTYQTMVEGGHIVIKQDGKHGYNKN